MTKDKRTEYERYGWTVDETNLATLPTSAPQAAKDLTAWLTLEGRRSSLEEWLGCVNMDDCRIHGKFWHIGAWTQRMSHSKPNQANIASAFHETPKNAVEEIKARYDHKLRECWTVEDDALLVGTDAEGIQLRLLAHYMKSEDYIKAITEGKKEDETDIHNLNKKALGPVCRSRDAAKTFIYAYLLGASASKVAEILECSSREAKEAMDMFLAALPELKKLKSSVIPRDASRGYFVGLDGRKVKCDSEHHMLAGYLQAGEAVVVKNWVLDWTRKATAAGLKYKLVDVVHDETQTEVYSHEDALWLTKIQEDSMFRVGKELGVLCPLSTSSKIGQNWKETH